MKSAPFRLSPPLLSAVAASQSAAASLDRFRPGEEEERIGHAHSEDSDLNHLVQVLTFSSVTSHCLSMTTPVKKVPIHLQSAQNRLLIKGGTVVNHDGANKVDVYVEDGKVRQVGTHLILPGGTRVIDATDKFVLPGGVDADTHFQEPHGDNLTQTVDDFYQGTRAALVGGTTTVVDCVRAAGPGETLKDAYAKWRGWAEDRACCDYALRVAVRADQDGTVPDAMKKEMEELTGEEFGVNAFRLEMSGEGAVGADRELMDALAHCRAIGALAEVRAESGEIVSREERRLLGRGVTGPEGFAMAHSEMSEEEATMRASTLAGQIHCPLLVGPMMSPSAVEVIKRKKARQSVVFGQTTPAALACDGEEYWNQCWRHAAGFVCSPPIRKGVKDEMVHVVTQGPKEGLDILASAHTTFNASQKALGKSDFTKIPVGVNGAEERMSVLWEKTVHAGKMEPTQFVAMTSATPAKLYNLYPAKGRIEVGAEADIVIWNPAATKVVSAKEHQLKTDFNVFEGMTCHGVAETVLCRGKVVVDEGQIRVMQGFGRFLPVEPYAPFVYDQVRAKEMSDAEPMAVDRSAADMEVMTNGGGNGGAGDIPPPTPPKTDQAVPAPSQQLSSVDLTSHPNPDAPAAAAVEVSTPVTTRQSPTRSSVRVRAPPGGRSSGGFW